MDEFFRNMYPDSASFDNATGRAMLSAAAGRDGALRNGNGNKTLGEAWRDVMIGGGGEPAMTLEDFLAKATNEEDVRVPAVGGFGMEATMMSPPLAVQFLAAGCVQNVIGVDFGSGMTAVSGSGGSGGRGRRKAAVEEVPLDKATQQKQRRMIKNRESQGRI